MKLSSKVHDNLSNSRHRCLFSADLKHAYYIIGLHPKDRHLFAFIISGIEQIQPIRMQQDSMSAGFTLAELMYRVFGFLPPPHNEPSLLHSPDPAESASLTFYMNDIFGGFGDFEKQFAFLKNQFFPRIEWARLRLTFKKLHLFAESVKALNVIHEVGGYVRILDERMAKIAR